MLLSKQNKIAEANASSFLDTTLQFQLEPRNVSTLNELVVFISQIQNICPSRLAYKTQPSAEQATVRMYLRAPTPPFHLVKEFSEHGESVIQSTCCIRGA